MRLKKREENCIKKARIVSYLSKKAFVNVDFLFTRVKIIFKNYSETVFGFEV